MIRKDTSYNFNLLRLGLLPVVWSILVSFGGSWACESFFSPPWAIACLCFVSVLDFQANLSSSSPLLKNGNREVSHPTLDDRWPSLFYSMQGSCSVQWGVFGWVLLQPTGWQGNLNVKLWAWGLECSVFAVGEQKETKLGEKLHYCSGVKTCWKHTVTAGPSRRFALEKIISSEQWGKKYILQEPGKWTTLTPKRRGSSSTNASSVLSTDEALHHASWQRKYFQGPNPLSQSRLQRMNFELRGNKPRTDTMRDE